MTKLDEKMNILFSVLDCELDKFEAILRAKRYPKPFVGLLYRWSNVPTNFQHAVRVETTSIANAKYFKDNSVMGAIAKAEQFIKELPDFLIAEEHKRHEEIEQLKAKAQELGFRLIKNDQQKTETV